MASTHGGVVHPRAVDFARLRGIPLHVRHSRDRQGGTVILRGGAAHHGAVTGVALRPDIARLTLAGLPDQPGVLAGLLGALSAQQIAVEDLTSAPAADGSQTAVLIVAEEAAEETLRLADAIAGQLGAECAIDTRFARVTVVGRGWRLQGDALPRLLEVLAASRINVHGVSTSEVRVGLLVERGQGAHAVRALHSAFGLERQTAVA
jgi:aspartate kinase